MNHRYARAANIARFQALLDGEQDAERRRMPEGLLAAEENEAVCARPPQLPDGRLAEAEAP